MPEHAPPTPVETDGPPPAVPHTPEVHHPDGRVEHPQVHYEHTDASLGGIILVLIWAMFIASLLFLLVLQFFFKYRAYEADIRKSAFPLAPKPSQALPSEPRLQPLDLLTGHKDADPYWRQKVKEDELNRYGHTAEKGFVHIPIDRAIQHVAGKLPARKAEAQERDNGLVDAGESNSGRMYRKEARWSTR